jgi:CoA binding domain
VTGTDSIVERILTSYDTITVVGASRVPYKAAHSVPAHMQRHGWRIIPVNPHADQLLGEPAEPGGPRPLAALHRARARSADMPWIQRSSLARNSSEAAAPAASTGAYLTRSAEARGERCSAGTILARSVSP